MPSRPARRTFRYNFTVKIPPPSRLPEKAKVADFCTAAYTNGAKWLTTGKTHIALGLGGAACQKGMSPSRQIALQSLGRAMVGFTTAAALVHELMEARDERRFLRLQKQMVSHKLLIIDEFGFVSLSKTGAELLFELISQRYERGATLPLGTSRRMQSFACPLPGRACLHAREGATDHPQPAIRRMDRNIRLRALDRRAARPADPPRRSTGLRRATGATVPANPRNERRQLSSGSKPGATRQRPSLTASPRKLALTGQSAQATASYMKSADAWALAPAQAALST